MKHRKLKKLLAVIIPLVITTVIWVIAKLETPQVLKFSNLPLLLSQIFSLWGVVLLSINYLIATRFRLIERLYGGLDKSYVLHKYIGRLSFILILAHPLLLVLQNIGNSDEVVSLLLPLTGNSSIPKTLGIVALYIYIILVVMTFMRRLPYELWKNLHKFMGVAFIIAGYHVLNAESDAKYFAPMQLWMVFWLALGIGSYIYKLLLYNTFSFHYGYKVERLNDLGEVTEIYLRPIDRRINFEPGEFVFMRVLGNKNIKTEEHPLTISSSPMKDYLRITYKTVGDWTTSLDKYLKVGDHVELYGPYGEFSSYVFDRYKKQLWISGGIGVAAFLSMLEYESQNEDRKEIKFFYCNRNEEQAVYKQEIEELATDSDDKLNIYHKYSDSQGMPTAEMIAGEIKGELTDYLIMMSGTPVMVRSLRDQFIALGVAEHMIIYEDFGFN